MKSSTRQCAHHMRVQSLSTSSSVCSLDSVLLVKGGLAASMPRTARLSEGEGRRQHSVGPIGWLYSVSERKCKL